MLTPFPLSVIRIRIDSRVILVPLSNFELYLIKSVLIEFFKHSTPH